jgi:MtfA peptidase
MFTALTNWWSRREQTARDQRIQTIARRRAVADDLWQSTLTQLPLIASLPPADLARLRVLVSLFLDSKEFSGAQGMQVSDAQAVMVAAQACLPVLHIAPPHRPDLALAWYDGFVGIVLHPAAVRARREWVDDDGIAHSGSEELTGEILEGGPLMLAWSDVAAAGEHANDAYNVVIHEFIHVMDVRDGQADGCPPMPAAQRKLWLATLQAAYEEFCEASQAWERFGRLQDQADPVLDAYGTSSIDEFFAVAAEAYFVQSERFAARYPALAAQFDAFFKPAVMQTI